MNWAGAGEAPEVAAGAPVPALGPMRVPEWGTLQPDPVPGFVFPRCVLARVRCLLPGSGSLLSSRASCLTAAFPRALPQLPESATSSLDPAPGKKTQAEPPPPSLPLLLSLQNLPHSGEGDRDLPAPASPSTAPVQPGICCPGKRLFCPVQELGCNTHVCVYVHMYVHLRACVYMYVHTCLYMYGKLRTPQ